MTPQQRHEQCIRQIRKWSELGYSQDWENTLKYWNEQNDIAVAAFYGLPLEQLETNIQVCWR